MLAAVVTALVLVVSAPPPGAAGRAGADGPVVPPAVVERTIAAVGMVRSAGVTGSGWAAGPDTVVTNFHVARGGSGDIWIDWSDGERAECWTAAAVRERDLAVLRCPTGDRRVVAVDTRLPGRDDPVVVVGYPKGQGPTVTTGVATGERTEARGITTFGFTAGIQPGSSGSPVVDARGRARGVATFGGGWAVPAADLVPLLERAGRLPVTKSGAEWRLRLRRVAVVVPVVALAAFALRRRSGRGGPVAGALRWGAGAAVAVLVLTQVQFALAGPTSFF